MNLDNFIKASLAVGSLAFLFQVARGRWQKSRVVANMIDHPLPSTLTNKSQMGDESVKYQGLDPVQVHEDIILDLDGCMNTRSRAEVGEEPIYVGLPEYRGKVHVVKY